MPSTMSWRMLRFEEACNNWRQSHCLRCEKKMWREKLSFTGNRSPEKDLCLACSKKPSNGFFSPRKKATPAPPPPLIVPTARSASPPPTIDSPTRPPLATATPPPDFLLDDLGVTMATFRELRSLQAREITENDYDLLMRLHAKPNKKVLSDEQLAAVTETFECKECLPCAGETCAVCLSEMAPGTTLCRLKCSGQHAFHADCIKEWLTTASTCCPVDQQDLSMSA